MVVMEGGDTTIVETGAKKIEETLDNIEKKIEPLMTAPPHLLMLGWVLIVALIIGIVLSIFNVFSIFEIIIISILGAAAMFSAIERQIWLAALFLFVVFIVLLSLLPLHTPLHSLLH